MCSLSVFAQPVDSIQTWTAPPYWSPPVAPSENVGQSGRTALAAGREALVAGPVALPFIALPPCRLVDTRAPIYPAPLGGGFLPSATVRSYTLTGVCALPVNAKAISLNATVVKPVGPGFLTLWPEGGTFPPVSTLNFLGNDVIVNAAVVPLSPSGGISMALGVSGGDVILDTNGYYASTPIVTSLNSLTGDVTLQPGANVTLTPGAGTLSIAAGPLVSGLNGLTGAVSVAGTNGLSASAGGGTVTVTSNATPSEVASTIVSRDGTASFSAGTVTLSGNLVLPASSSVSGGSIFQGPNYLLHTSGVSDLNNLFVGIAAGNFATTGTGNNVGIGNVALFLIDTGFQNTAVGASALANNAAGSENTGVGAFVLANNTAGNGNTAVGSSALNASIGSGNTAVGARALISSTGSANIAVGLNAGSSLTTGSGNIDIGHAGLAGDSNTIRIGGSGFQTAAYIAGIRGVTTVNANAIPVLIDSSGQLGTVSSSIRFKEDVRDMDDTSAKLMHLRPVTFRYKAHRSQPGAMQFGLIAEEVEEVMPELVARSADGEVETVMYQFLPSMLLNEYQKQQRALEAQAARLDANAIALQAQNDALSERIEVLEKLQQELLSALAGERR
jgi:hypothetical protein